MQNISRTIPISVPETPGTWEVLVGYGAFDHHGGLDAWQKFIRIDNRPRPPWAVFPVGVLPSQIYEVCVK
jgi:hypothetical protein